MAKVSTPHILHRHVSIRRSGRVVRNVILAERLAKAIESSISQVSEPYRSRLLAWIEGQMGEPIQGDNLSCWLHGFDAISMIEQYQLLQIVCDEAARIFGDKKTKQENHRNEIETKKTSTGCRAGNPFRRSVE